MSRHQGGFALGYLLLVISIATLTGAYFLRTSPLYNVAQRVVQQQQQALSANEQLRNIAQAAAVLAAETKDAADGYPLPPAMKTGTGAPGGGGFIPDSSKAPKFAGAQALGYCAWDNGPDSNGAGLIPGSNTPDSPVIAVLAPGADGLFQTSCAQAATGAKQHDDLVITYSTAQLRNLYSLYVGAPVSNSTALAELSPGALRDGELRLVKTDGAVQYWDAATQRWLALGADRLKTRQLTADQINSGELTFTANGSCVPLFTLTQNAVYTVYGVAATGMGYLRVGTSQVDAQVLDSKFNGDISLQILGNQVCAQASAGQVKTAWIRTL